LPRTADRRDDGANDGPVRSARRTGGRTAAVREGPLEPVREESMTYKTI
jgi:hypothetical protein